MEERALSQRYIPKLNRSVTFFGLGTVELGRDWGIDKNLSVHPSEKSAEKLLNEVLGMGIGVVDSVTSYQLSEERIGKYIPPSKHSYLLITKSGEHSIMANDPRCKKASYDNIYCRTPGGAYDFSPDSIRKEVTQSLKNLKANSLDVVLLHLDSNDAEIVLKKGDALRALHDLKKEGIIHFVGVSINGPAALYAVKNLDIDVIELEYNLLNQTNEDTIRQAHEKGIGVVIRGGLGTGLLTASVAKHLQDLSLPFRSQIKALLELVDNDYDSLTALELYFLYSNPNISTVILGADFPEYMKLDIRLLNEFNQLQLLRQAEELMASFPSPESFTEIMGEYYASEKA